MGTCASQENQAVVDHSLNPSAQRFVANSSVHAKGISNSLDNSSNTAAKSRTKSASNNSSKQSYDSTTADTALGKSTNYGTDGVPQTISRSSFTHKSPSECAPTASDTRPPQLTHKPNELYWCSLVRENYDKLVDPADVVFIIDERMCSIINRLSPAEVSFVQRRVRSVVQSLLKVQGDTSQPEVRSKAVYNEFRKLDEFAVRKIFSAGHARATNGSRWWYGQKEDKANDSFRDSEINESNGETIWQRSWKDFDSRRERRLRNQTDDRNHTQTTQTTIMTDDTCPSDEEDEKKLSPLISPQIISDCSTSTYSSDSSRSFSQRNPTYNPDPISAAYTLLNYISDNRWTYLARTAQLSAVQSNLILDVNKKTTMQSEEMKQSLNKALDDGNIPVPPLYPGQAESAAYYRCDLNDKSSMLPILTLSPGVTMKEITFLVSMALRGSRTQKLVLLFYLLLPIEELNFVLESHPTGGVPTWLLELESDYVFSLESLSHYYYCGGHPPGRDDNSTETTNELKIDALSVIQLLVGLFYVQDSVSLEEDYVEETTFDMVTKHAIDPSNNNDEDRKRFLSYDYSKYQSSKIHALMTNFLQKGIYNFNDVDFDDGPWRERTFIYLDTFWAASEMYCTVNKTDHAIDPNSTHKFWTLKDFLSWADEALSDEGSLTLIMESLFGTGIIPSPVMERYLVSRCWTQWQKDHFSVLSKQQEHIDITAPEESKPVFYWESIRENDSEETDYHSDTKYVTWGGIGGLDGGGQLGFGIMYCIDKRWWERWASYVKWPWSTHTGETNRPSDLSMERLLDYSDESLIKSHGSYKCMKRECRKDEEYVLIPPTVWDLLYELYGGGPPLPRFILPFSYQQTWCGEWPSCTNLISPLPIYPSITVEINPWVLDCHLCDPKQPYRRAGSGSLNIRLMVHPNQPMWRLFSEIIARLPITHPRAKNDDGEGFARLWKRIDEPAKLNNSHKNMDAWELIFNNGYIIFSVDDQKKTDFFSDWDAHSDSRTVSSAGLYDGSHIMLEYAIFGNKNFVSWPRQAAAKADKIKKLADEDEIFRLKLRGLDINGQLVDPNLLVGLTVDALDDLGCWYHAIITRLMLKGGNEMDGLKLGNPPILYEEVEAVLVRFCNVSNRMAWITVDSDKLAIVDRFSTRPTDDDELENESSENDGKLKNKRMGGTLLQSVIPNNQKLPCKLPYFGACALSNLGNTCYMNVSIQCLSYIPFLRSYLLSDQFIINDDINRNNPLGTGGIIVDAFSDLLQIMWSGKHGVLAPREFRNQLVKVRQQYAGLNQQDAQEFLSDLLDSLHEDCNKILSKPIVEPLDDTWVKLNTLQAVGAAAWRRFLRRNYSLITDVAMGQALNTVTCPICGFSSRNFDPFSILSLPIPSKRDDVPSQDSNAAETDKVEKVDISSCLDEFCQEQTFGDSESWKCTNCDELREGIQRMALWKLPDILFFHLKRFNCDGESREKITTLVSVPLTSLNMRKWCYEGNEYDPDLDHSYIYDLIGVIDHIGTMTGGHYVALCKATGCCPDGSEEVSHSFSGASVYPFDSFKEYNIDRGDTWRKWFASNKDKESSQDKALAAIEASKAVAESCEPTWLRFDDDQMEPIPPSEVISERAYVLFFRRRRISPSNMAKYSTIT